MTENNRPVVLSVASFTNVHLMDGGDTVAVCFQASDGQELAVLVPRGSASDLQAGLADLLTQPLRLQRDDH